MKHVLSSLLGLLFFSCNAMSDESRKPAPVAEIPPGAEVITLAAGCFWCSEAVYLQIDGVISSTSGFMGGKTLNPSYEQVCTGKTGHAEVVQLVFDPEKISLRDVLTWFWKLHDPTSLNRQGNDIGTQYRSAIFYTDESQRKIAEESKREAAKGFDKPIVTEISKASTFYPAEKYLQDYYARNKDQNPYCQVVIRPKLKKLKLDH